MIRDYISGMQMAYFPPFKLFFLLTALTLVVDSVVNLKGENYLASYYEQAVPTHNAHAEMGNKKEIASTDQWNRTTDSHIDKIVLTFFGVYNIDDEFAMLLCIIPLKQLSGFKWWRTSLYVILSYIAVLIILYCALL